MANPSIPLPAFKGPRGDILLELKRAQPLTAKELAAKLGVSPNAIRHHLKELEAEGLVVYGREQRGVGAPTFTYRLSDGGEALFPKRYAEALTDVLGLLAATQGREVVVGLFERHYADLSRKLRAELEMAPAERRVEAVTRVMSEAGYMAEWSAEAGTFRLAEHNCAMRAVVGRFPEICAAEVNFLREVLAADVERKTHIASGCNACEYAITFGGSAGGGETEPEQV